MAIRFILGRAGSGKTHHCLTAVREQLRHDPIDGPRLILLVPEQAALQMERAVLDSKDITAAHRVEVLSFRRLAFRVLASVGSSARRALSEPARAMVLRHLVAKRSDQLKYYRRADRLGGFVTQLSATITELIQEAVTPDSLGSTMEQGVDIEPMQRAKLHDIREIYEAYLDYLGTDRVDPSQHLEIARGLLPRCDWIRGAEVWVDGFASLARQETLTLISLARLCRSMEITGLVDPSLIEPGNSVNASGSASLFHKTHQTYIDLCRQFAVAGLEIQDPLLFGHKTPPRFKPSTPLARLERSIFELESAEPRAECDPDLSGARAELCSSSHTQDAREIAQTEVCGSGLASQDIELAELPSRRIEVEYAVSRICQWVEDPTTQYRYRDIAIIARDLDPYHDLLTQALSARDIPFFIDRRRGIAHHPLPEFLRASVLLAATNWSLESVRIILKTGLLPVSVKEADELENYLLAYALCGYETWCGADWSFVARRTFTQSDSEPDPNETARLARINQTRRQLVTLIEPWMRFALDAGGHTGTEWAAAIMDWLESAGVGRKVEAWIAQAEQDGDLDLAAEHRQVWRDCLSFVDDVGFALADERLTADELGHVFEAGLSSLTLGLAPPMVDQILVGSIERSRHPDLKAVVVIGFNDGLFPQRPMEDAILNDDDRAFLRDRGVEIRPPSRDRIFDEPLLVYIAVTRPSDRLLITTAATDAEGKALRPSPYLDELERVCPGLRPTKVADPVVSRNTWDILTARDLTRRIVAEMRTRGPAAQDDEGVRARWNGLYDSVREALLEASGARYALSSLSERPQQATISPATLERLHHGTMLMSVSQLETYAACPFQHFSKSVLKLTERAEAPLARVDVGQVHHAILEDLVEALSKREQRFDQLSDGELLERLQESCDRVGTRLPPERVTSSARDAYALRRTASQLARIMRAQRNVSSGGAARPRWVELPFGFDQPGSLPALDLHTPAGRLVKLRGFIDRVDLAELSDETLGIVIDYKGTRDKRLDLSEVHHGLSLQLVAYLLVLAQHGKTLAGRSIVPAAALYVSLKPHRKVVDHPSLVSDRTEALPPAFRPRGLIRADKFDALEKSTGSTGWSERYAFYQKKDGSAGHIDNSDAADAASFQAVLDRTRTRLGQLADQMLDGDVAVRPYRLGTLSPCSWCAVTSVCRFEMGACDVRFLEKLKRSEVFKRLQPRDP